MSIKDKINIKNISVILSYLCISSYIVFGNCLTFNLANRMPIKIAEIIAIISCFILVLIHKKDVLKLKKENINIIIWFIIATIPMFLYKYEIKQIAYGILYSLRIIVTLFIAVIITNVFRKYEISRDRICNFLINNYIVVCFIGILQLIFYPLAFDFYRLFYNIGVYFANPDPHVERLISTYFDPNFLAACLIIPSVLSLDLFSKTGKKQYIVKLIVFIVTILLTVSRSGTFGLCIALFIYAVVTIKIKNKRLFIDKTTKRASAIMIITACVFIFLTCFTNVRVFKRILGSMDDPSTQARITDWSKGSKIFDNVDEEQTHEQIEQEDTKKAANEVNSFFGIGYNMIGFTEANQDKQGASRFGNDSSLILIYISSGILGTIYFVYLILSRIIKAYKDRTKYKNNMSMITIIITALVICNFNNLLFYILWLFPIFILLNINENEEGIE